MSNRGRAKGSDRSARRNSKGKAKRPPFKGVYKDPLDLRDLMYEGNLSELPFKVDNRSRVPIILNQGEEGACTGFGLAAVVNYLRYNRSDTAAARKKSLKRLENSASPRMAYEMAKRYDEWKGENYEGSSIRGALKGWLRHGICSWKAWPYDPKNPDRLSPARQLEALGRPLGAYFRVRHLHLNQMQSALSEAGILYASASVHEGWYDVDPDTGLIPYSTKIAGGHAFAIVGYDREGFWIQNSWGPKWGSKGFCKISYDDWLQNGYDCWVARLGVPTVSMAAAGEAERKRAAEYGYIPHESVVLSEIQPHFVNLGNDGRLSQSGIYSTDRQQVDDVVLANFTRTVQQWDAPAKLLLYAHGGLNDEKASASRIASLLPYFKGNQIYPIHFMWESGFIDSISGIVQDAFRGGRFQGWTDTMKDKFFDLVDEGIELASRGLGKPVWGQMKQNARLATEHPDGGARYTAERIRACFDGLDPEPELHLVGHSAGSIFICHLIPWLHELGLSVRTLTLFAPACTIELFKATVLPALGDGVRRLTIFNMTDPTEQDDTVGPVYHKSLLYLVSEAFETRKATPLLGMEKFLTADAAIKSTLKDRFFENSKSVIYTVGGPALRLESNSDSHGGFDNDEATLNSTLRIVRGKNALDKVF